jgi:hypothetical protein
MAKKILTVIEAGRRGGQKTSETHGREFYEEIGRKGGQKTISERGPQFYSQIGKLGGRPRKTAKKQEA